MEICRERQLSRVVRIHESGDVLLDVDPLGPLGFPFLILELAAYDTHGLLGLVDSLDVVSRYRVLHHASVGLLQLHRAGIAHQDIKASNVVFFSQDSAKLADLGRAVRKGEPSHNDDRLGDATHVPLEYLYGYAPPDWNVRHFATDLYLLGSLAFFLFSGISLTHAIGRVVVPEHHWSNFHGSFEEALPAIQRAFNRVIADFGRNLPGTASPVRLCRAINQLAHPDPAHRGHPANHRMAHGNPYSMERFVSQFDLLARAAHLGILR